jgi:cell division protein FtsW
MAVSVRGAQVDNGPVEVLQKQGTKLLAALVMFLGAALVPMQVIRRWAIPSFAVLTVCCALPRLVSREVNGAYRWLYVGPYSFQPVEPARFCLILAIAWLLARAGHGVASFRRGFLPAMGCAGALTAALMAQPDNGNALIVLALAGGLALVAGVRFLHFVPFLGVVLAGFVVLIVQHDYVRRRLHEMLDTIPASQVGLGLIAVGSGGLFGRGLGQGWMKMGYVPEAHNDFVFAIIGEELGYVGSLAVLAAYTLFGYVCYRLVCKVRDPFLRYVVCGYALMICMQAAANLLVVSGWAPAKGIDLPFVSTGGTSLMFCLGAVGLIGNAARTDRAGTFSTAELSAVP